MRPWFNPWIRKIPWRGKSMANSTPIFCQENPMDREALAITVHGGLKELYMSERLHNKHNYIIIYY